jgi:N-formylglutamate amidohydrolase
MEPFRIYPASEKQLPVIISVPHCGINFPDEIRNEYKRELIEKPDDTDWFVDQLYDFASAIGITMIAANYNRWVIDLNRNPDSTPLYTDGRIITALCPTTDFLGVPIYSDNRKEITQTEVQRRLAKYFWPYHHKLQQLLDETKAKFGQVILWDCHSIRQSVKTIQKEKFPDLILGSADGSSASREITSAALRELNRGGYELRHNNPFKGGFITRHFGNPMKKVHALQLEMTKVNYMNDQENEYHPERAEKIRSILKDTLSELGKTISS